MSTLTLTAGDWFTIRDRGWAASFHGIPDLDPRPLKGQQVVIDGKEYKALGIETPCIMDATGHSFSILVGER